MGVKAKNIQKRWVNTKQFLLYYWKKYVKGIRIDSEPIFIVGCGHSGTSLLLSVLGTHSRMHAITFESNVALGEDATNFYETLANFDKWAIISSKRRWIEKTPKHIQHIGKILEWCPQAKILIIVRDGRDVAYSIKKRYQNNTAKIGAERWVNDNLAGKQYWHHPHVHLVKYEQLISDFDQTMQDILAFLNEEYEDRLKNYYKYPKQYYSNKIEKPPEVSGKHHEQYRNWQINQPIFDGRKKWQNLSQEELAEVEDIEHDLLVELGYMRKEETS